MAALLRSWMRAPCTIFQNNNALGILSRNLTLSHVLRVEEEEKAEEPKVVEEVVEEQDLKKRKTPRLVIDAATSARYVDSEAFVKGYGDKPVWFHYRRNFKGQRPPQTRKNCIRQGEIDTASPCPVCRDEYLVLDSKNIKLLEHFISPLTGEIFDSIKTGLCQKQQQTLVVEVMKAWDDGGLEKKLPFRFYNYNEYKK